MAILRASDRGYRFLVLFFNCMLTFGSYFCFDMPSVLQDVFTKTNNCTNGSEAVYSNCSDDGLGMSDADYNLLYAIYAWTNAVVVIGAGFLIDKLGNRVGVFLFSSLCLLGSSTFAAGAFLKGTSYLLPIMLFGRLLFGSGNGSLTIVQNRITAYWFRDKELAMAFGITLAFSRLGSVLNFFLTQMFEEAYGLKWTLWGGAMLCLLGFISAIIVTILDKHGVKELGDEGSLKSESKKLKITDVKHLSLSFWLVVLAIMFFYNGVFPFVADASKFIQTKYKLDKKPASYVAGAIYDVSMIVSPFLGGLIDVFGKRGYIAMSTAVLTIPVFGLLAFSYVHPLICTLWLGVTYSFAAASMWPSIPLVVSQTTLGTAMGLTTSVQMVGIGISNVIVGQILGKDDDTDDAGKLLRWKYVMIFLLGNTICCILAAFFLNVVDRRRGGILNISKHQKLLLARQKAEVNQTEEPPPELEGEEDPLLPGGPGRKYLQDGNSLN
ncbi:unnamed protein product [Lymnaea stagnalis]|uniref:Lysosomal dipeptide transporter MFSD1 n=1 Tax=Lymnaea stagnalis TaxID=6523 RepID=A0AAV2HC70_LYMST